MKRYELLIGRRYLRSSRGSRFVSFISTISMVGVAIGVAVLIVVLSVMNGFERELRERILQPDARMPRISAFGLRTRRLAGHCARGPRQPGSARRGAVHRRSGAADRRRRRAVARSSPACCREDERQVAEHRRQDRQRVRSMRWRPGATASCSATSSRRRWASRLGERVVIVTSLRTYDAGGRHAAHARVQGRGHVCCRHVRVRSQSRLRSHGRCGAPVPHGRHGNRSAPEARRHVRRAARRARSSRSRSAVATTSTTGRASTRTSSARSS